MKQISDRIESQLARDEFERRYRVRRRLVFLPTCVLISAVLMLAEVTLVACCFERGLAEMTIWQTLVWAITGFWLGVAFTISGYSMFTKDWVARK